MPYNPPKKGVAFVTYIGLQDCSFPSRLKNDPTIVGGDVRIKKDGAAFVPIITLPSVDTAGDCSVRISLSASEMNADNVVILFKDLTDPPQWADRLITIVTTV